MYSESSFLTSCINNTKIYIQVKCNISWNYEVCMSLERVKLYIYICQGSDIDYSKYHESAISNLIPSGKAKVVHNARS